MAPSSEEDLDWLYGRDRPVSAPEPTRRLAPPGSPDAASPAVTPAGSSSRPASPSPAAAPQPIRTVVQTPPAAAPAAPPSTPGPPAGYPSMPAYGQPPGGSGPTPPWGGGPAGPPPPSVIPKRRKKRHPVRNTLLTLLAVVLLAAGWLIGVPAYAWSSIQRVDDTPAGRRIGDQPGQAFLLVGSDSREGLTKEEQKKLGTGSVAGQRTDTIMILFVPTSGKPALISLPRDSYVAIPGNGKNKINAAYAFGGPQLLVQTVEQATGLRLDGYLEIGFGGFVNVIDALGGIRMCLPAAIKDKDSHIDLPKGCQTLSGTEALGYVRMRKADPRGDLGRVERQREMLAAVAKKAASPASIANPVSYWRLCTASAAAVKLGPDTSLFGFARLALAMKTISGGGGFTLTVPVSNPGYASPVGSAVLWDSAKAKAMFADLAKGDTSTLGKYTK